ncbi:ribonuclease PH [Ferrithrix thermotolerans DSM 19514]|jgi:ribonuclease PH|uniref:Ribonuclease PH n=1 Tax=Ferrithrix thermotolerans DSM 19514 TaxID=1121881 RepID=A0A1M4T7W0_9ACTN|nr:ribonuclease PH [Ferrithrix thermotolerans]SHE40515.1 ribonuclease PH [Ferrithrix thermotolerans DSM 19514]
MRRDGREPDELRAVAIERGFTEMAAGSALVTFGKTKVICTASIEEKLPPWLRNGGKGWVTAEYSLLPGSTPERSAREAVKGKQSGRTQEIQRLIARSLRSICDLKALGEVQITLDCDVIQADGGTRTASITGAYVALVDAVAELGRRRSLSNDPITGQCAAISVGVVGGEVVLDLDYSEDSVADVDMNVVMNDSGEFIELQGTGEGSTFSKSQLVEMVRLAERGVSDLLELQRKVLGR